jgi:hypothetical protein
MGSRGGVQLGMSHRSTKVVGLLGLGDGSRCLWVGGFDDLSITSTSTTTSTPFIFSAWRSHHTWILNPRLRARGHSHHLRTNKRPTDQHTTQGAEIEATRRQSLPWHSHETRHRSVQQCDISRSWEHAPRHSAVSCWPDLDRYRPTKWPAARGQSERNPNLGFHEVYRKLFDSCSS